MPGNQLTIVGHYAGQGPTKLWHAAGDLGNLIGAVNRSVAGVGPQPINRPGLYLAGREGA